MSGGRFNGVAVLVGGTGTGKTDFLLGNPSVKVPGIARHYLARGMKIVIYNNVDHPKYRHLYTIQNPDDLKRMKSGIARIVSNDFEATFSAVNKHLWNTFVVFEDSYKYVPDRLSKEQIGPLLDAKQRNLDFLFMYHSWGWMCRDLGRKSDIFIVCKTPDLPAAKFSKADMPYRDELTAMCEKVNASKNNFEKKIFETRING